MNITFKKDDTRICISMYMDSARLSKCLFMHILPECKSFVPDSVRKKNSLFRNMVKSS